MSGDHRSLCWNYFATAFHCFTIVVCNNWDGLECLPHKRYLKLQAQYTLCSISALTSNAISVDRLQALLSGLRYRHIVTLAQCSYLLLLVDSFVMRINILLEY